MDQVEQNIDKDQAVELSTKISNCLSDLKSAVAHQSLQNGEMKAVGFRFTTRTVSSRNLKSAAGEIYTQNIDVQPMVALAMSLLQIEPLATSHLRPLAVSYSCSATFATDLRCQAVTLLEMILISYLKSETSATDFWYLVLPVTADSRSPYREAVADLLRSNTINSRLQLKVLVFVQKFIDVAAGFISMANTVRPLPKTYAFTPEFHNVGCAICTLIDVLIQLCPLARPLPTNRLMQVAKILTSITRVVKISHLANSNALAGRLMSLAEAVLIWHKDREIASLGITIVVNLTRQPTGKVGDFSLFDQAFELLLRSAFDSRTSDLKMAMLSAECLCSVVASCAFPPNVSPRSNVPYLSSEKCSQSIRQLVANRFGRAALQISFDDSPLARQMLRILRLWAKYQSAMVVQSMSKSSLYLFTDYIVNLNMLGHTIRWDLGHIGREMSITTVTSHSLAPSTLECLAEVNEDLVDSFNAEFRLDLTNVIADHCDPSSPGTANRHWLYMRSASALRALATLLGFRSLKTDACVIQTTVTPLVIKLMTDHLRGRRTEEPVSNPIQTFVASLCLVLSKLCDVDSTFVIDNINTPSLFATCLAWHDIFVTNLAVLPNIVKSIGTLLASSVISIPDEDQVRAVKAICSALAMQESSMKSNWSTVKVVRNGAVAARLALQSATLSSDLKATFLVPSLLRVISQTSNYKILTNAVSAVAESPVKSDLICTTLLPTISRLASPYGHDLHDSFVNSDQEADHRRLCLESVVVAVSRLVVERGVSIGEIESSLDEDVAQNGAVVCEQILPTIPVEQMSVVNMARAKLHALQPMPTKLLTVLSFST